MADEAHPRVGTIALEHPGTGADGGFPLLEVPELLDALAGDDGARHGVGHDIGKPCVGLTERDLDGVAVHRLGAVHHREQVALRIALDGAETLEAVDHVLRGQLSAVDGRLGMPPHALAQLEEIGRLVGL